MSFGRSWTKKLQGRIQSYEFEVGVLDDKDHLLPVEHGLFEEPQTRTYAGGPVRKQTREKSGVSIGQVLVNNMERLNINLLSDPFQRESAELIRFTRAFLKSALAKSSMKRVENLLQAVVRNPILREEYGPNSSSTADAKGFDRHLFDTGQMFKAIKARAKRV